MATKWQAEWNECVDNGVESDWSYIGSSNNNITRLDGNTNNEVKLHIANIQNMVNWLNSVEESLSMPTPLGGLPQTASMHFQSFMRVYNSLKNESPEIDKSIRNFSSYSEQLTNPFASSSLQHYVKILEQRLVQVVARAEKKKTELAIALAHAGYFQECFRRMRNLLIDIQKKLDGTKSCSTVTGAALVQIEQLSAIQEEIADQKDAIFSLKERAEVLETSSNIQDGALLNDLVVGLYYQWKDVTHNAAQQMRMLEDGYKKAKGFAASCNELSAWCDETERKLNDIGLSLTRDPRKIKQMFAAAEQFQKEINTNMDIYTALMETAELEKYRGENIDASTFQQMRCDIQARWRSVWNKCINLQKRLEEDDFVLPKQFLDIAEALIDWQSKVNFSRMLESPIYGHLDAAKMQSYRHQKFEEELNNRMAEMKKVRELGKDLMRDANKDERAAVFELLAQLDRDWERITSASNAHSTRLSVALAKAEALNDGVCGLLHWVADAREALIMGGAIRDDRQEILRRIENHDEFMDEMLDNEALKDEMITLADEILERCDPDDEETIRHMLATIEEEWGTIVSLANKRKEELLEHFTNLEKMHSLLQELLSWLASSEMTLMNSAAEPMPDDSPSLNQLINDCYVFQKSMFDGSQKVKSFIKTKQPVSALPSEGEEHGDNNHTLSNGWSIDVDETVSPQQCDPQVKLFWDRLVRVWNLAEGYRKRLSDKLAAVEEMAEKEEKSVAPPAGKRQVQQVANCDRLKKDQAEKGLFQLGVGKKPRLLRFLRSVTMVRVGGGWLSLREFVNREKNKEARRFRFEEQEAAKNDLFQQLNLELTPHNLEP